MLKHSPRNNQILGGERMGNRLFYDSIFTDEPFFKEFWGNFPISLLYYDYSNVSDLKMNIADNGYSYIFEIPLPGVARKNIDVMFKTDKANPDILYLIIEGKRVINEPAKRKYIRKDFGDNIHIKIAINVSTIHARRVKARFEDGMLIIVAPKKKEK